MICAEVKPARARSSKVQWPVSASRRRITSAMRVVTAEHSATGSGTRATSSKRKVA